MVTTVLLSTLAAIVVLALAWAVLRHERVDETERFHRASEITSSWAAPGPQVHTTGGAVPAPDAQAPHAPAPHAPAPGAQAPGAQTLGG